jgi:tellurite methyltransferase
LKNYLCFNLVCFLLIGFSISAHAQIDPKRFELLSGIRKSRDVKSQWDQKYSKNEYIFGKSPARFLSENYSYIPHGSTVLDVGMGEGRNAVFLATKGYKVTGVDISSVAIRKAQALSQEFGVRINTVVTSMNNYRAKPNSFDAIICFYFVDKSLHEKFYEWLKPGGILIYEAHTTNQLKMDEHYNKNYLLKSGELLTLFPQFKVLKFEEPMHQTEFITSGIFIKPE